MSLNIVLPHSTMMTHRMTYLFSRAFLCASLSAVALGFGAFATPAAAQINMEERPVLVITDEAMPSGQAAPGLPTAPIYQRPGKAPEISADEISGDAYFDQMQTPVGRKIDQMRADLFALQTRLNKISGDISQADRNNQQSAAKYNANVATINTALQSGTTPGNPRLVARLNEAQNALDEISQNITDVNGTSVRVAELSSMASFLLEAARSTYALSGAIEEDHMNLAQLEDQINGVIVLIDRLQIDTADTLSRTNAFLAGERDNLRTLSLGVSSGNMFGSSLRNRGYDAMSAGFMPAVAPASASMMPADDFMPMPDFAPAPRAPTPTFAPMPQSAPALRDNTLASGRRSAADRSNVYASPQNAPASFTQSSYTPPVARTTLPTAPMSQSMTQPMPMASAPSRQALAKIRFNRPDVNYEQPVYRAVSKALEQYPNANIELVAVTPQSDNAAQMAIETTRARRNAEDVMRSLEQMGVPAGKLSIGASQSPDAATSEVHVFIN